MNRGYRYSWEFNAKDNLALPNYGAVPYRKAKFYWETENYDAHTYGR